MDKYSSQAEASSFAEAFENFRDRVILIDAEGQRLSYGAVDELAREIYADASSAKQLVFVVGDNSPYTLAAYLGGMSRGHVVHLLDPEKPSANEDLIARYCPNFVITCGRSGWKSDPVNRADLDLHPDLCLLLSTSGSTGSSKFVKLSYRNVVSNAKSIAEYLDIGPEDRSVTTLKPFYSYGISVINSHFISGASLLLTDKSVQDVDLLSAIERCDVTNIPGVPYSFELLKSVGVDWGRFKSLRFVTQAGGRLAPDMVQSLVEQADRHGWRFFVMYGQTEASPRISYLPPSLARSFPEAIGVAIPGGRLFITDSDGNEIGEPEVTGELTYAGPNVMIGYATEASQLATAEAIEHLKTGDLALRLPNDLFVIKGRKARFVKHFGLRIGLDEIEAFVSGVYGACAVVGTDELISVFIAGRTSEKAVYQKLALKYGLPDNRFHVSTGFEIPHLTNGKTDYQSLIRSADENRVAPTPMHKVFFGRFFGLLTGWSAGHSSVDEAFGEIFPGRQLSEDDSYRSLDGDSMNAVRLSIMLEDVLGQLPEGWIDMSIKELESMRAGAEV